MPTTDLGPAAATLAVVLHGISDAQLGDPTPCPKYTVGDLVDHVGGLTTAFTEAATKAASAGGSANPPPGDATRLAPDWRSDIPAALDGLAAAWRDDEAWEGMTAAGGIEMPGAVAGLVALNELVVHGWDLARATDQPFDASDATLAVLRDLVAGFAPADDDPDHPIVNDGTLAFGPAVAVSDASPLLDQVVALTGRDPAWSPPR